MNDLIIPVACFLAGLVLGYILAVRSFQLKTETFKREIETALDSVGIKRSEFVEVLVEVKMIKRRLDQLDRRPARLR